MPSSLERPMSNTSSRRRVASALAGLLAVSSSVGAMSAALTRSASAASPSDGVSSLQVDYGDLDLSTDGGARILLQRITAAAERVCPSAETGNLDAFAASHSCRRQAIARAVRQVGSPRLAALHVRRSRHG